MSASSRIMNKRIFGICGTGTFTIIEPGLKQECVCCGKNFKTWEIVVELFEYDVVCPECILAGPKEMARRIRTDRIPIAIEAIEKDEINAWHPPYLMRIAKILEEKESIADFSGGIFAVKIAEAYREIQAGKAV